MGRDRKVNELANMYRIGTQSAQLEELIRNTVQSLFLLVFSGNFSGNKRFFFCCHTCTLTNCGVVKCSSFIQPLSGSKVGSSVPLFYQLYWFS